MRGNNSHNSMAQFYVSSLFCNLNIYNLKISAEIALENVKIFGFYLLYILYQQLSHFFSVNTLGYLMLKRTLVVLHLKNIILQHSYQLEESIRLKNELK